MGGLLAQMYLERDTAPGAVLDTGWRQVADRIDTWVRATVGCHRDGPLLELTQRPADAVTLAHA